MRIAYILKQSSNSDTPSLSYMRDQKLSDSIFFKPEVSLKNRYQQDILKEAINIAKNEKNPNNKTFIITHKSNRYYYKLLDNGQALGLITNGMETPPKPSNLHELFEKIKLAKDEKDLQQIILNPEQAMETKIDKVAKQVDEVKDSMMNNIKLAKENGDIQEKIAHRSDVLLDSAIKFESKTTLYNSSRCYKFWHTLFTYLPFSGAKTISSQNIPPTPKASVTVAPADVSVMPAKAGTQRL